MPGDASARTVGLSSCVCVGIRKLMDVGRCGGDARQLAGYVYHGTRKTPDAS